MLGINEILTELRIIREVGKKSNEDEIASQFETDYRVAVIRTMDRLKLFGVDLSHESRSQKLSVAYIGLSVKKRSSHSIILIDESKKFEVAKKEDALSLNQAEINQEDKITKKGGAGKVEMPPQN